MDIERLWRSERHLFPLLVMLFDDRNTSVELQGKAYLIACEPHNGGKKLITRDRVCLPT
jgi:hypothetical protein